MSFLSMSFEARKKLGEKVRVARETKNLTQSMLASKVGQNNKLIASIERGDPVKFTKETINAILDALEIA